MLIKTIILFVLAVCFQSVMNNEASKDDLSSIQVRQKNLEVLSKRVFAKLQKNHKTLKDAFEFIDRKQRIVPNPIAFHSSLQTTYSQMSSHQAIPFEFENTNVGGGYDRHFGLFQAPVSGYYQFVLTFQAYPSSSYMVNLEVVRNGNVMCSAHGATYGQEGYCVAMVHLSKGDDVWVRHYNGEGTYLYYPNYVGTFSGHLIKAS